MKRYTRVAIAAGFVAAAVTLASAPGLLAQDRHGSPDMHAMSDPDSHRDMDMARHHHPAAAGIISPTMPGQDAFGAIQEIVQILEADPATDWSKVNLEALRQHLIDMNEVTLKAETQAKPIDGGLQIAVTGEGRTSDAIKRMVTAHAQEIERSHLNGWTATTEALPNGVILTVKSDAPKEVEHIRGLGFIGIMTSGAHHQPHHLAIARGEMMH